MSYARFRAGISDVYVYHHYQGFIECCGCGLTPPDSNEMFGFFEAHTAREILGHLEDHRKAGDLVPDKTFERIKEEYPDLDEQIERYEG